MSRTQAKDALNLSSSSISVTSDASEEEEEDDQDVEIERILSEVKGFDILDALPPTPKRPTTRSQSRCSVASAVSSILSTPRRKEQQTLKEHESPSDKVSQINTSPCSISGKSSRNEAKRIDKARKKRTEKDILKRLGIDMDDEEMEEIERQEDNRIPVDNIIDDLLGLGLGQKKAPGTAKNSTAEEEQLDQQYQKLRKKMPLEINGDGRCAVLNQDVTTIKNTLESVNALIAVLEQTRDKLVNEDKNLVFTQPPFKIKKKPAKVVPEKEFQ